MNVTTEELQPLGAEELARLPIFPLPRVVFFPHTDLPLHVFERRYRALVEDCLADGPLAMAVALLEPGWEQQYEGRPPIREVAGAGRIVAHEKLADGRHNILLRGIARVRLEEVPNDELPYRVARATVLEDRGTVPTADVRALLSCATPIVTAVRREHAEFELDVSPSEPPGIIADRVADRLVADVDARQSVLETLDVAERVQQVTDHVGELMAMLAARRGLRGDQLD